MNETTKSEDLAGFPAWKSRKTIGIIAGVAILGIVSCSLFAYKISRTEKPRFVEGVHFKILDKPYDAKNGQLDDYYWLNCDSCYMFEPVLKVMTRDSPQITVNKIHATSSDMWIDDSKLDTSLRALGRQDLIDPFFEMAIKQKGFTKSRESVNSFLQSNGVDVDRFWAEFSSPSSLAKALERSSNSDKVGIRVVPTFVLDGRYKILLGGLKKNEELSDLVKFLEETQPTENSLGVK
jgi:hypothetical protein